MVTNHPKRINSKNLETIPNYAYFVPNNTCHASTQSAPGQVFALLGFPFFTQTLIK